MKNKTISFLLLGLGLAGGVVAIIATQSHAQQVVAPVAKTLPAPKSSGDIQTPGDTDNTQDPGGVEQPDTISDNSPTIQSSSTTQEKEYENQANDTDGGANKDLN